jgi:hypothetical protein
MTPAPKVKLWLAAVGKRTGLFDLVEASDLAGERFRQWDEVVMLRPHAGGNVLRLLVEYKARFYPQDAIIVAHRVREQATPTDPDTLAVVAAPYISERVADICREHKLGYIDAAGNCHLAAPGFHLHVEGGRNQSPDTRAAENLFAPKSSRIVRVLLEHPDRIWKVKDLAREAQVSMGLASRLKHKLIAEAFVEESSQGMRVRQPEKLLETWAAVYSNTARTIAVYSMDETRTFEHRVARWCAQREVQYALAEFSAAARWSQMVRYKRAAVYIREPRSQDVVGPLIKELALKEVDSGSSAILWVTNDEAVFFNSEERDGEKLVSPLQAYLDLARNPARGQEAADELLRRHLLPRFADGRHIA